MTRQLAIEGTRQKQIKEVNDAGEAYYKAMRRRVSATQKETETREALIAAMAKHDVATYRDEDHAPPLTFILKTGKTKVAVETLDEEPEDDDEGDGEK